VGMRKICNNGCCAKKLCNNIFKRQKTKASEIWKITKNLKYTTCCCFLKADYTETPKKKVEINTAPEHKRNKKNALIYKHLLTLALQRIQPQ
jgi:hypothetical protein